ncbi:hypothetical protein JMJ85_00555 [Salmonella enterica subsp. diarizonae]|uniref:Uncharacterized protein n=1 Tax=Salmonella diarizonae TaxID=59204 RepID=A0A8F5N0H0_SALDZ|nr:hypothetical protein JMJ85_00555 [Salmonella enterica subsp. diarizonae]
MCNPGQVNIASIQDALSHAMNTATTSATPHPFSQADLKRLSGFLISAPYLIQGMSAVIESYEEPATSGEARHV